MAELQAKEYKKFEEIKHIDNDGTEFWYARELSLCLEYAQWRNFAKVIDRAMLACQNSGFSINDHFVEVGKSVEMPTKPRKNQTEIGFADLGKTKTKTIPDYKLTRYACYLIVQNGDPRKEVIALGQTYFAIQTRRQEVQEYFNNLDEDNKRLVIRGDIKQWNQMLAESAHNAGVITEDEFAVFQNAGYMGLYGGETVKDIHERKGLSAGQKILDYRNGKMTINIVQRMLSNRRYIGEYKFQKTVVPNGIPAIISEELFNRVQEILAKNKRSPARKKAEDEYLLTLKLFCGKCGAHMVGESGTGTSRVYRYYKCANTKKIHICDKKPVRKEWIEELAVKAALDILKNDEIKDYLTDRIYALQGEENPRIPKLKAQLADVEKRLANIMQAIEQGIIFDTTKERFAALEKEKKELEIAILQEKIKKPFLTKEQIRFGIEKFGKLDISTKEGKQRLIDGFINAIYVYDDKITFTFNYKDGTRTVMLSELSDGKNNSDLKCQGAPLTPLSEYFG